MATKRAPTTHQLTRTHIFLSGVGGVRAKPSQPVTSNDHKLKLKYTNTHQPLKTTQPPCTGLHAWGSVPYLQALSRG